MNNKFLIVLTLLLSLFMLSSCDTTYNDIEYKNLSDEKNYEKYDVKFSYARVLNENNQRTDFKNKTLELTVTFLSLDELNIFKTIKLENVSNLDSYPITFLIFKDNTNTLLDSNFFDDVKEGDIITVWVNTYRGIDTIYNYLGGITFGEKTYLSLEDGLNGIIKHMDEHRSPWLS